MLKIFVVYVSIRRTSTTMTRRLIFEVCQGKRVCRTILENVVKAFVYRAIRVGYIQCTYNVITMPNNLVDCGHSVISRGRFSRKSRTRWELRKHLYDPYDLIGDLIAKRRMPKRYFAISNFFRILVSCSKIQDS